MLDTSTDESLSIRNGLLASRPSAEEYGLSSTSPTAPRRIAPNTDLALTARFTALIAIFATLPALGTTGEGVPYMLQIGIFLTAGLLALRARSPCSSIWPADRPAF